MTVLFSNFLQGAPRQSGLPGRRAPGFRPSDRREPAPYAFLALVLLLVFPLTAQTQEAPEYHRLEQAIYGQMRPWKTTGDALCAQWGLDPRVLWSCIYIEMAQYELDPARKVKKSLEGALVNWQSATGSPLWPNLSLGFAHIKPGFARDTRTKLQSLPGRENFIGTKELEPLYYSRHPETCLKIAVAGLALFQKQWQDAGYPIHQRPEILATLYNLGYAKSQPKPNPQTGGTSLPMIMDGKLIPGLNFGDKTTLLLAASRRMAEFLKEK